MYNYTAREIIHIADYTFCTKRLSSDSMNRIRDIRKKRGLSLDGLAKAINTSADQISKLERGERQLTLEWMNRIAPALGVKPADLISESTENNGVLVSTISDFAQKEAFNIFRGVTKNYPDIGADKEWEFIKLLAALIDEEIKKHGKSSISPTLATMLLKSEILGEKMLKKDDTHQ